MAREASLAMTTLYLYFSDLSELLGAVLEPVMALSEESYVAQVRTYWPDETLGEHCRKFIESYLAFWVRHSRILHLRNSLADSDDQRMWEYRLTGSAPLRKLFIEQMEADPTAQDTPTSYMARLLITAIERTSTVSTDANYPRMPTNTEDASPLDPDPAAHRDNLLGAMTRVLELVIMDGRAVAREAARRG